MILRLFIYSPQSQPHKTLHVGFIIPFIYHFWSLRELWLATCACHRSQTDRSRSDPRAVLMSVPSLSLRRIWKVSEPKLVLNNDIWYTRLQTSLRALINVCLPDLNATFLVFGIVRIMSALQNPWRENSFRISGVGLFLSDANTSGQIRIWRRDGALADTNMSLFPHTLIRVMLINSNYLVPLDAMMISVG